MAHSTSSPAKKKSKLDDGALKNDHSPMSNLLSICECGNDVASFLTLHERGRLLLVNHQLNSEHWGILKEKTYCQKGLSAVEAAKLIFRIACSEFGPERLTEWSSGDAIAGLRGCKYDFEVKEHVGGWKELKNFWCPISNCYDISSLANEFPKLRREEDRNEVMVFFQKVNALLPKLKASCDYLERLEKNSTARPDLYQYLIEEAGVEKTWLDRFAEIRHSTWGKACFSDEDKPSYQTRSRSGYLVTHPIDCVFPRQDTIRALPSKSYKPKPIHLRECIKCHEVRSDISYFECPYKSCGERHLGKCGDCAPTSTCVSCNQSGCLCCFVSCSIEGCTRMMCNCGDFGGWKYHDRGGPPGCSYVAPRRNEGSDDEESDGFSYDQDVFCDVHKPEGAVEYVDPYSYDTSI